MDYPKEILIEKFGILGEDIYEHANGRDESDIRDKYIPVNKNLSLGQVLMRDYTVSETRLILKEMVDELCIRLRQTELKATGVSLMIRYSFTSNLAPFAHQLKVDATDLNSDLYNAVLYLFDNNIKDGFIRQVGISFGGLVERKTEQLSLFKNLEAVDKERNLYQALDEIYKKYGKNKALRGSSLKKESTIRERHNQIGGHRR